jgi:hypothetical protein
VLVMRAGRVVAGAVGSARLDEAEARARVAGMTADEVERLAVAALVAGV